jgi:GDP-mannose 6-dehydrogenase
MSLYQVSADVPKLVTDTRTAAMVKYTCNAFHALKVAFANEIGALAKSVDANGQEVMRIVCQDKRLNISPAYLRPGFAFGGSCLPKDVRALVRYAQRTAVRADLLQAILSSNGCHIQRAVDTLADFGRRRFALAGLSFKAGTDDLRESPMVLLAESLLGRGCALRIFDPGVSIARLRGRNRAYIDKHLPHLAALLVEDPPKVVSDIDVLICGTEVAEQVLPYVNSDIEIFDLRRDLVTATE